MVTVILEKFIFTLISKNWPHLRTFMNWTIEDIYLWFLFLYYYILQSSSLNNCLKLVIFFFFYKIRKTAFEIIAKKFEFLICPIIIIIIDVFNKIKTTTFEIIIYFITSLYYQLRKTYYFFINRSV